MRINNCVDCKEYKYLIRDCKCQNCINEQKINFGKDENDNTILMDKNKLYRNVNIMGGAGSGKTTMAKNIHRQFSNDNEHGVIYFSFREKLDNKNVY